MAQLKIDVIIDDNGAAQKLKQIESGVQGIESASAKAKNPIGEVVTALTSQSQASDKVVVSATKVEQASARQLKNLSAESAAWLNNASAQTKAALGTDDLKKRYDAVDVKLQELNTTRTASAAAVGLEMAVFAALGTVAVAELKFLYESTKAYVTKSGILEQHAAAIAEVKDAWEDLLFLAGQQLVGSGANFNDWIYGVSVGLRILGVAIVDRISDFQKLLDTIGMLKNIPAAMFGFGFPSVGGGMPEPANALRDVDGNLTAAGRMQQFFKNRDLLLAQRGADFGKPTGAQAQSISDQADRERLAAEKAAQRAAQAIIDATRERRAQLSGQADIDFARQMMADVAAVGGVLALSEKDIQKYNDALEAAADALQRQGKAITTSDPIFQEWLKSLNMHAVVGLGGKTFGTSVTPPSATGFYGNLLPQAVQGLPGGLPGTSADLSNINPLADVGFFKQAFGTGKQLGAQLGQAILGGIQGGWKGIVGNVGSMLGGNIGGQLGGMLSQMGGFLGGLGGMLGPLGSMLGGLAGNLIGKLFGPSEYEKRVRAEEQQRQELKASLNMEEMQRQAAFTGRQDLVTGVVTGLQTKNDPEYLRGLVTELNDKTQELTAAMQRYGISWEELGSKAKQSQIDEMAKQFITDFKVLNDAGASTDLIIQKMSGSVNEFIQTAIRTGTEVPIAMQPMVQKMADMGLLVDQTGAQLEVSSLNWSMTMTQGFQSVAEAINHLAQALGYELPAAAARAANGINSELSRVNVGGYGGFSQRAAEYNEPRSSGGTGGVTVYVDASDSLVHSDDLSERIAESVAPFLPGAVESYGV